MQSHQLHRSGDASGRDARSKTTENGIEPALVVILLTYRDSLLGQQVLDIAVGDGPTPLYLSRMTADYIGIDPSESTVSECRARFPSVRFEVGSADDLSRFADQGFRLVLSASDGIGSLDHEARLRALAEIARVLQPGGIFAFSALNRNCPEGRDRPRFEWRGSPLSLPSNLVRWFADVRKHAGTRGRALAAPDYAVANDRADDYSRLHYYIDKDAQRRQVEAAGLEVVEMHGANAAALSAEADDRDAPWIWYVARKAR
jgi:SAM-dependent methyltransferase